MDLQLRVQFAPVDSVGRMTNRGIPLADLTYTVVDLETTGLKPYGNGITEVCCLRVQGGRVVHRFTTLVNPGRPIPAFIQAMTGITDAMVRDAPGFGEVIPALLDFVSDTVLVAHNAPFDLSFLNYGLYCHGYRALHNPVVDTLRLARRLLPQLQRGGLDAVTLHLGIRPEHRHRAAGDAEATAQVLLKLLELSERNGVANDVQLLSFLAPNNPRKAKRTEALRRKVDSAARTKSLAVLAERCRSLPDAPGVYSMRGGDGEVLYVGKAVSLRRRLVSYFNGVTGKIKRLMRSVEAIHHVQLGSELEALLEESRLIKLYQPPFNTLLRSYRDYPFIKVDGSGPYPRLEVTRRVGDDDSMYFGPFRGMRATELVMEILRKCFRLFDDRCPTRTNGEACLYHQMGRCLAPCMGGERIAAYGEAVAEVCRLLESDPRSLVDELVRRREAASEKLDYETAAIYRDGVDALGYALSHRRLLAPAIDGLNVLAVCPSLHLGWAELFVFGDGRLVGRTRVAGANGTGDRSAVESVLREAARRRVGSGERPAVRIDAESLDQVNIISSWLGRQGAEATTIALEPGWATQQFHEVVDSVAAAVHVAAGGSKAMEELAQLTL